MSWDIPLFKIYWDDTDITSVENIIRRGNYWTNGPEIQEIEKMISEYSNRKYGVTFNSGTSALQAILQAYGIKEGEVIIPSFTFISTANSVVLSGAKPIFAEIENDSYGLSSEDVKEKISSKTQAIIPIHYGGMPCKEINTLKEIADDHQLVLIEDAAESIGAKINNKMVGNFGDSAMFSFCQNKIITSGEGGIIVTDSKKIHNKLKLIRSHGRVENKEDYFSTVKELDYVDIGYNYRLSSISSALLISQFMKIEKIIKIRQEKAKIYDQKLSINKKIKIPLHSKNLYNVYQMYTIQLENNKQRNHIQNELLKNNIMSKVYFEPIHLKKFYKNIFGYTQGSLPVTEDISKKVLSLPIFPTLQKYEIEEITKIIHNCLS